MFSSGSTWVFNIVAQLLCKAHLGSRVVQTYADEFGPEHEALASNADCLVFKTHAPSPATRLLARLGGFPIILSIRDPRDAITSLMQRFSVTFDWAFDKVVASNVALIPLKGLPHLLLRYEDGFTNREDLVAQIAQHLGLCLSQEDLQLISAAMTPDAVKATIADLQARNIIAGTEPASTFDPQTHWHPRHVGDLRMGKWREYLTPAQAARVRYATRDFCSAFGYDDPGIGLPVGEPVYFSTQGTGVDYLVKGFAQQEDFGVWTADDRAVIQIKLEEPVRHRLTIELQCRVAHTLRRNTSNSCARIQINGTEMTRITADDRNPADLLLCLSLTGPEVNDRDSVEVRFEFDNLLSPATLGIAADSRLLGLGLLKLMISD